MASGKLSVSGLRLAVPPSRSSISDRDGAERVAQSIIGRGGSSIAVAVDISDPDQVDAAVEEVIRRVGRVDVLVNSVGWNIHSYFRDQEPGFWRRVVEVNLLGQIHLCHAVLEDMVARKRGAIVNVSSDAGRVGTNGETVYAAAKGGVIAFTKSLAREVTRFGIRVNCVAPGPTDTPMLRRVMEEQPDIVARMTAMIPMRRIAEPDEQAAPIVFLASDEASYITGQVLSVNGGLNMVG